MASSQRSVLASLLAVGIAASAVHVSPNVHEPAVETTKSYASSSARAAEQAMQKAGWSGSLDLDPKAAGRDEACQELTAKLGDFLGHPVSACPIAASVPAAASERPTAETTSPAPLVLFATLPDPVHTDLALRFDRALDAMEDALQDSGWAYQGYWLPWSARVETTGEQGDFKAAQQQRLFDEGRQELPGVMLFRPRAATARPLVVFIVGDSPISGINKGQFQQALSLARDVPGAQLTPLRLLGPNFSGSGASLQALLSSIKSAETSAKGDETPPPAIIASSSISTWHCEDLLPHGHTQGKECLGGAAQEDSFVSFSSDAQWEERSTIDFLVERSHIKPDEIAILTEDETGFGALGTRRFVDRHRPGLEVLAPDPLRLKFPLGISRLRTAYQQNSVWGFGHATSGSSVSLNLDLAEPRRTDDAVPSYARQQLPVSQEGSMRQITALLEQRRIRAVLLSATDVMDQIFVAQMLAREAPNVAVILRESDVLFLRSGDQNTFHNMYAISPYPLIPKNLFWADHTQDGSVRRTFPSADAEGTYNAALYLVKDLPGAWTVQPQDYTSPLRKTARPPLWFSVIEHGSYWPMGLLDDPESRSAFHLPESLAGASQPRRLRQQAPVSLLLLALLVCVGALVHAGKCLDMKLLASIAPEYHLADQATRTPKLWLRVAIIAVVAVMVCLLAPPAGIGYLPAPSIAFIAATAFWALSIAAAQTTVLLRGEASTPSLLPRALGFLLLAGLLWIIVWVPIPSPDREGMGVLFIYRSNYLLGNASPVFPLLLSLGGLALYLLNQMHRLTFSRTMAPRLPARVEGVPNCPTERSVRPINDLLAWPPPPGISHARLTIATAAFALELALTGTLDLVPRTIDNRGITIALDSAMFLVLLCLLWDLATAAILWRKLKTLCLSPLEATPLRRGFNTVRGFTWKELWLMPQSSLTRYRALTRALEQASRTVMQGEGTVIPGAEEDLAAVSDEMWVRARKGQRQECLQAFVKVQKGLAATAESVLKKLAVSWAERVEPVTLTDNLEEKEKDGIPGPAPGKNDLEERTTEVREEWVALIYLHYIRRVLLEIRSRVMLAACLFLVLVWSITSYPYLNQHSLMIGLCGLLGVLAFTVVVTYASINRDPILSRTTESPPGKLDFDFYMKIASLVGIPLIGLIASQFPEASNFLFSWIEPGMSSAR